jgi:hypothetical protein
MDPGFRSCCRAVIHCLLRGTVIWYLSHSEYRARLQSRRLHGILWAGVVWISGTWDEAMTHSPYGNIRDQESWGSNGEVYLRCSPALVSSNLDSQLAALQLPVDLSLWQYLWSSVGPLVWRRCLYDVLTLSWSSPPITLLREVDQVKRKTISPTFAMYSILVQKNKHLSHWHVYVVCSSSSQDWYAYSVTWREQSHLSW